MSRGFDVASSILATALRFGAGGRVRQASGARKRPGRTLVLYEFEGCPYCRRVREVLSELDLDALIYPCPRGGTRFRPRAVELGGRERFPLLVDPNTGASLQESSHIIRYVRATYDGQEGERGSAVALGSLGPLGLVSGGVATAVRLRRGRRARPATGGAGPAAPLELWSFEACPYCRLVREVLCELEIPYLLHNVARGSAHREGFVALSGRMMVPFLHDPNAGRSLFESADIVRYLETNYAPAASSRGVPRPEFARLSPAAPGWTSYSGFVRFSAGGNRTTMVSLTHRCVDCGTQVPPQDDDSALISIKYGWRLTRTLAGDGETALEWRCPDCWVTYRSSRGTGEGGRRGDGRG